MELSTQQTNVLSWAVNARGSLNLVARAGCGKSTTLLELVESLVKANTNQVWFSTFLGAYNRPIADQLQEKLTARGIEWKKAQANTMHGAGWAAWRKFAPECKISENDDKVYNICCEVQQNFAKLQNKVAADSWESYTPVICKLVSLAKQRAFGFLVQVSNMTEWFNLIDHFGLDEEMEEEVDWERIIKMAIHVLKISFDRDKTMVDFDDMILAPLVHNVKMWQYDWVLIDEAQDTNPARRALAFKMMKPKYGRMVVVGDPAQAIYGFTGADSDSMDIIQAQLSSRILPLNVTYRCPKSIVALAQTWVPDITAADSAPEGVVRNVTLGKDEGPNRFEDEVLTKDDVILCRNTKPLVGLAYDLLRKGVACRIEGKSIAEGLVALVRRWKLTNITALLNKLPEYKEKQIAKLLAKGKEEQAGNLEDTVDTVVVLAQACVAKGGSTIVELVAFIQGMFGDTKPGTKPDVLTLSTVHKAKGREWPRVYLLGRNMYMPNRYARKEWQMQQETNLMYVAVTRAMKELVEIEVR